MFFLSQYTLYSPSIDGRAEWNALSVVYRSMASTYIYIIVIVVVISYHYISHGVRETSRSVNKSTARKRYRPTGKVSKREDKSPTFGRWMI